MKANTVGKFFIIALVLLGGVLLLREFFPQGFSIEEIRTRVSSAGALGPVIFGLTYIIAVIFALPASPLSLLAGALFGPMLGTITVVIAATIGATSCFVIAKYIGRSYVQKLVAKYSAKLETYNQKLEHHGLMTVLTLRLLPVFPFNALNYLLGVTRVRLTQYFLGTLIGIIPGTFVFVYAGATATEPSVRTALIAGIILLMLFSIGPLYKKFPHHDK